MTENEHIEDMARVMSGNFLKFTSFGMSSDDRPADPENWTIYYTLTRDSRATCRSNAKVIAEAMEPHLLADDCSNFTASHWAVGWTRGYLLRVRTADGALTPQFTTLAELLIRAEDYCILDESALAAEEQAEAEAAWTGMSQTQRVEYLRECSGLEMDSMASLMACARGDFPPYDRNGYGGLVDQ